MRKTQKQIQAEAVNKALLKAENDWENWLHCLYLRNMTGRATDLDLESDRVHGLGIQRDREQLLAIALGTPASKTIYSKDGLIETIKSLL